MTEESLRTALVRSDVLGCPGSVRGGLSVRECRRKAGKCDNLSFLRVFLSRMDCVLGSRDGYVLGERGRVGQLLTGMSP